MHSRGTIEKIHAEPQKKCQTQQQPFRGFKRQENNKDYVKIRIQITSQLNVIK